MNTINVFCIPDILTGRIPLIITIICIISIAFAISVITVKNPIISVLFLIGLFITVGSYLIIIGIEFIGLSYLLVYVGAVSILFLFILMLINVRVSELINETRNSVPLVFLVTLIFGNISFTLLPQDNSLSWDILDSTFITTLDNWDGYLTTVSHITSIGNVMYSTFSIWLIMVSSILLLAMIGAIVINIKQVNKNRNEEAFSIIQSRFHIIFYIRRLSRILIICTIIWYTKLMLIAIFNFDISEYINNFLLSTLIVLIDFIKEFIFLFKNHSFMLPKDVNSKTLSDVLKDTNIKMSNQQTDNTSGENTNNQQDDNKDSSSEYSYHSEYTEEQVQQFKTDYERLVDDLSRSSNNETEDRDGNPLKPRVGILQDIVVTQQYLDDARESKFVEEVSGGRSQDFKSECDMHLNNMLHAALVEANFSDIVPSRGFQPNDNLQTPNNTQNQNDTSQSQNDTSQSQNDTSQT